MKKGKSVKYKEHVKNELFKKQVNEKVEAGLISNSN